MITDVNTALQMTIHQLPHYRPGKNPRFAHIVFIQNVQEQGSESGPQPVVRGNVEAFFLAGQDRCGKVVSHQFAQNIFEFPASNLEVLGQARGEFYNPVIQKRRTDFQGVRHAHAITLIQNVVGKVIELIGPQKPVHLAGCAIGHKQRLPRTHTGIFQQHLLFGERESPVPIEMRELGLFKAAVQKALKFVIEAELGGGHGQPLRQIGRQPEEAARHELHLPSVAISPIGVVASKQFVRTIAGKGHGNFAAAHLGKKPNRQRTGIGAGLIGISGEFLDGSPKFHVRVQVQSRCSV